jgi:hypothetical protein
MLSLLVAGEGRGAIAAQIKRAAGVVEALLATQRGQDMQNPVPPLGQPKKAKPQNLTYPAASSSQSGTRREGHLYSSSAFRSRRRSACRHTPKFGHPPEDSFSLLSRCNPAAADNGERKESILLNTTFDIKAICHALTRPQCGQLLTCQNQWLLGAEPPGITKKRSPRQLAT